jgi:cyclopropane-fatty-acyl-phospholipid synthase
MAEALHARFSKTLQVLFCDYDGPPFSIALWDGWSWNSSPTARPVCTIVVATAKAAKALILGASQVALGEAFIRKDIDIEGDIFSVFAMAEHLLGRPMPLRSRLLRNLSRAGLGLSHRLTQGSRHSRRRDRASIAYHYDQPVEFFRPWLGSTLVYSCAYFEDAQDVLDDAQENKLDLICRKLRLEPGQKFLEIGCGWGSLILHAAARYGVFAQGITLSQAQARVAEQRIADAGLSARCKVRLQHYRELDPAQETFDRIASVGMYEHVGLPNLPAYFGLAHKLLKPGGVFLNHGIARAPHSLPRGSDSFIGRYVFPDGELVTLTQAIAGAESAGFEVRDVENLREHYELTLRRWVQALRRSESALLEYTSPTTFRIWLLYMAGCAAAFRRADIGVYQTLLSRPEKGASHLPLTREDWYDGARSREALDHSLKESTKVDLVFS